MDIQKWKKKKEKAQVDGNLDSVYFACKELAELYFNSEKYDAALQEYREMEHMSEISGNQIDVARANRMIGEVFCAKGEFEKAIRHQLKHLVISRDEKNKVEEQRALATLGRTYFLQGESIIDINSGVREKALGEAKKFYMESLAICHQLTDADVGHKQRMEMVARLFLNIGLVLDAQNQFQSAIDHMQKAVSICKKLDLWEDLYRTYSALGGAYQKHYEKNQAIKTFDLALSVAERLSNKAQMMCDILQLKADVLLDLPDVRGARQVLLKAYKLNAPDRSTRAEVEKKLRIVAVMCENEEKLTELSPDSDYAERKKIYEEMGDAASEINNFKLALSYYHLMLECVEKCGNERKALIDSYISLAQTYKDDHQLTKALEFFQKELKLEEENSPEACKTLLNIAEVNQLMGRRTEMYQIYEQAKLISNESSDTKLKATVLSLFHAALIEDNKISEAGAIKKELAGLEKDPFDDSSDEEEEPKKDLGAHISLDDLTDEESKDPQEEKAKTSRARTKRSGMLEKRNEKGETPLHVAAINGNLNLAIKLLDQGHRVDVKDYSGWTPLHEACNHGHSEVVRVLLERGAPINDRGGPHCDGVTPLLDAASNGNLDIIELLLNHGASPLMRTNSGDSVIDCLSGWRKRRFEEVGADLQGTALAQYSTVYKKLAIILENAGQKLSKKDCSPLKENSNRMRPKKPSNSFLNMEKPSGLEKKVIESSKNAANEYENAMKALRFRISKPNMPKEVLVPVRGLVNEDEVLGDDWLEDDLDSCRPRKKARTGELYHELIGGRSRNTVRPVTPPSPERGPTTPSPPRSITPPTSHSSIHEQMDTTYVNSSPSPTNDSEEFCNRFPRVEAPSPGANRFPDTSLLKRKQVALTTLGVVKKMNFDNHKSSSETSHSSQVPTFNVPAQTQLSYSCVKVKIEGKTVIVPVPGGGEGLTISWLATEAATRYKSLEGVEPVLQLEMEGGGLLINSDPLSIVTQSGIALVEARVLSWNLSSPVTLYEEACLAFNTSCDAEVKCILDSCQATGVVSIEDMYLKWTTLAPLLRAIAHYQPLQSLVLSSNNISDVHILDVAECVSKLPQLRILDLSNTNITENGLEKFSQCITKNNALKRLEEIRLGHNPLGDCLRSLSLLLNSMNHLRHLSIPDIGLTSRSFPSFTHCSLDCIEKLDANYNSLAGEGVRELLGLLDPRVVKELRLAGSGGETVREVGFYLEQRAPLNLRLLDLSLCPYSSADLQQFLRGAGMCEVLENISLGGEEVPEGSLEALLTLPLRELSLCAGAIPPDLTLPNQMGKLVLTSRTTQQLPQTAKSGPYGLCLLAK